MMSDPWGGDTNPNPESRRKSPTRRVVSPIKGASQGGASSPQRSALGGSSTPQAKLRSPSLQAHEVEAFWAGKKNALPNAVAPQGSSLATSSSVAAGGSDSPSRQRHARSPSPSAMGAGSPSRPIFPGYSHCSNHAEKPVVCEKPGHRVAKMWSGNTMDQTLRMAPGGGCAEPLMATVVRSPVVEPCPAYSDGGQDASVAGDEPVILLTPRCRPMERSPLPMDDKDAKAAGCKSPQVERRTCRPDGLPGRLQLPSADDDGPKPAEGAVSPLVERRASRADGLGGARSPTSSGRPTLPIGRAGSSLVGDSGAIPVAGLGKGDKKPRSQLSQVHGEESPVKGRATCRSPLAGTRSPVKLAQRGWK